MDSRTKRRNFPWRMGRSGIILCLLVAIAVPLEGAAQDAVAVTASLRAAADQGDANAQHELGLLHVRGTGVPQNREAGAILIERAAIQGHTLAQNDIGALYHAGQGVAQDFRKAALYYGLAAQKGHGFAALNMGGLYFNGQGVPQDSAQAPFWFTLAAQSDDAKAASQGKIWSDRLLERARLIQARLEEQERNSVQQTPSAFEEGATAALIFMAVMLALSGGDDGGSYVPPAGQPRFVPVNACSGWAAMSPACGG